MASILNLTRKSATPGQIADGVYEPTIAGTKDLIREVLTFDNPPSDREIEERARRLVGIVWDEFHGESGATVMIDGPNFLMGPLERELKEMGFHPVYAFSRREVAEVTGPDGIVREATIFRHIGFVPAQD